MDEELDRKIKAVPGKGVERIVAIYKLCLPLIPSILQKLESSDLAQQKEAVVEAKSILLRVQDETETARREEGLLPYQLQAALTNPHLFTPDELARIKALPTLIQHYGHLFNPPKKSIKKFKPPPPKV